MKSAHDFTECLFFILQVLNVIFVHSKSLNLRSLTHMTGGYMSVSSLWWMWKRIFQSMVTLKNPLDYIIRFDCSHAVMWTKWNRIATHMNLGKHPRLKHGAIKLKPQCEKFTNDFTDFYLCTFLNVQFVLSKPKPLRN